ncbi:hypothetical protein GM658_21105 [Pseudoduganella eburnea]|uniref:Uncharacterized protein n=1 Tax=Massilia eburnea TaxID=1776165 RepID=A0A6L6QLU3_9BURK|nr:hypothetical protein [Massilia eburnea]MTW13110.1 hypothetical protein [Massilia eburnea]
MKEIGPRFRCAQRDAEHARKEAELAHLRLLPPVQPERSKVLDVIEGVSAGAEVIGLIGDLLS